MKKVLLIGGWGFDQRDQERKRSQLEYMRELLDTETHCYMAFMDDLHYTIAPGVFQIYDTRNKIDLREIDVVFIRGMEQVPVSAAYYLSRYCVWTNTPCISNYSRYAPADKVAQAILFLEHGVPFLKTIYGVDTQSLIIAAEKTLGYPYILKDIEGLQGNYNYLIRSLSEAAETIARDASVAFLVQEYCPNDCDYRLLIMGKDHLLFERRGSAESHLNNTSKGAQATLLPNTLPPSIIQQSQSLAKSLGIMIAGVDIMPNRETGMLYFLEVNLQPQLLTGAFPVEKRALMSKLFDAL